MPEAGIVTLDAQPDKEHAFGAAAPLVAQWRELRKQDDRVLSRVDRVLADMRGWELGRARRAQLLLRMVTLRLWRD